MYQYEIVNSDMELLKKLVKRESMISVDFAVNDRNECQLTTARGYRGLGENFFKWNSDNQQWFSSPIECAYKWILNYDNWVSKEKSKRQLGVCPYCKQESFNIYPSYSKCFVCGKADVKQA